MERMETVQLAEEVLKVFEQQAKYFKSRDQQDLIVSKQMEKKLRLKCTAIIQAALIARGPSE